MHQSNTVDNETPDPFKMTFHVIFCKINQDILGRQGQSIGIVMDQFPRNKAWEVILVQVSCWGHVLRRNLEGSGGKGQGKRRNSEEIWIQEEVGLSLIPRGALKHTLYHRGCSTHLGQSLAVKRKYNLQGISWWGTASLSQRQSGNQPKKGAEWALSSQHLVVHWPSEGIPGRAPRASTTVEPSQLKRDTKVEYIW